MGDNSNRVTPVAGVDVVIKDRNNAENTSTARDKDVPIIAFDREKDSDATTGAAAGVSHTKGTKLASKSGSGLAAKGGGGEKGGKKSGGETGKGDKREG